MQCTNCQFADIPSDEEVCPKCGSPLHKAATPIESNSSSEHLNNSLPAIHANIRAGVVHGGQVTGVRIEQLGYSAEQVQALISQINSQFQPRPFSGECPFVGLRTFQETDAELFFGRERIVAEMVELLRGQRFLVIAGPSGCGKSSIARAGLLSALKRGAFPGSKDWLYSSFTPGSAPLESLGRAIAGLSGSLNPLSEIKSANRDTPEMLTQWLEVLLGEDTARRAILLVDQFEEVFTQLGEQSELLRQVFLDQLTHAVINESGRSTVILTLRSDYIANFSAYPAFNTLLNKGFFQIGAMSAEQLASAVLRPALGTGLQVDPALVTQVMMEMRDQPGALPLMQFALTDLFNVQISQEKGTALTLEGYLARGGLSQALERYANTCYDALDQRQKILAQMVFRTLVVPGVGHHDSARTANFDELDFTETNPIEIEAVIKQLADARLLTTGEVEGDGRTIRLAHERLLEAWPWLKRLVDDNRQAIVLQQEIQQDANRWQQSGDDTSYLYSGARLATAQERLAEQSLSLSGLAERFIAASADYQEAQFKAEREAREAEQRRELEAAQELAETRRQAAVRLRRRAIILGGVLLVAVGLLIWASLAQNQATNALGLSNDRGTQVAEKAGTATYALGLSEVSGTQAADDRARAIAAEGTAVYNADQALQQATRARAGELAASSQLAMQSDFSLGLLLALEAVQIGESPYLSAEKALRETSLIAGGQFLDCEIDGKAVVFSSDSTRVFFGGDKGLCVYDLDQGDKPVENARLIHRKQQKTNFLYSVSADGRWIVTNVNNQINIIDLQENSQQAFGRGINARAWALNSEGSLLALSSDGSSLLLVNLRSPDDLASIDIQNAYKIDQGIRYLRFSPDGRWLVAASDWSSQILLFDIHSADPYTSIQSLGLQDVDLYGRILAFSPDGRWLAVSGLGADGGWDISILLWDMETVGRATTAMDRTVAPTHVLVGQKGLVNAMVFNQDSTQLVTAGSDRQIHIWDLSGILQADQLETGEAPVAILYRGHDKEVTSLAIDNSGRWLASSGGDFSIRLWDRIAQPTQDGILLSKVPWYPGEVNFSPDGRWLAGVVSNKLMLWDLFQGSLSAGQHTVGINKPTYYAAWSKDWSWFAASISGEGLVYWKLDTNNQLGELPTPGLPHSTLFESIEYLQSLRASVDGRELIGEFWDPEIDVYTNYRWDMTSSDPSASLKKEPSYNETEPVICDPDLNCKESVDGRWLIGGDGNSGQVYIWDLAGATPVLQILGDQEHPYYIAGSSPDGRWFSFIRQDGTWLWDTTSGDITRFALRLTEKAENWSVALTNSWDKRWLAIWLEYEIFVLDLSTGGLADAVSSMSEVVAPAEVDFDSSLTFINNNHWLLIENISQAWLMPFQDLSNISPEKLLFIDRTIDVEISPNERWLAVVTLGNFLHLYDLAPQVEATGFKEFTYRLQLGGYDRLVFSQDGKWLASEELYGKSIQLWGFDPSRGIIGPFVIESNLGDGRKLEFHPSGRWLVAHDIYGKVHFWMLPLEEIAERACWATGRNLTTAEWEFYFPGETYRKTCSQWP